MQNHSPDFFNPLAPLAIVRLFARKLLVIFLISAAAISLRAGVTSLRLSSEPGEIVARGMEYFFTPSNGTFSAQAQGSNTVYAVFASAEHFFSMWFGAPLNQSLEVGLYTNAMRFSDVGIPALDISGDGSGCNMVQGNFEVKQITRNASGEVAAFWVTFEHHCEGSLPALRGELRFNADLPVVLAAPASIVGTAGGAAIHFTVTATESQAQSVSLSATNLPPGATFLDNGNNTGVFAWIPASNQAGIYRVTFAGTNQQGGADRFTTQVVVVPPNDDFDDATVVDSLPYTNTINAASATRANDDPTSCGGFLHIVWYQLTVDHDARIEASTFGSDYNTVLSVWTGSRGSLSLERCSYGEPSAELRFEAIAGTTYYFQVASSTLLAGQLVFAVNEIARPSNDDFDRAQPLSLPSTNIVDAGPATRAVDDPTDCLSWEPTVWYSFTPSESGDVQVVILEHDSYSALGLYTGSRGALQMITCLLFGYYRLSVTAGQTYYFMAGSTSFEGIHLTFLLRRIPPQEFAISLDRFGSFDRQTGLVTLEGTVSSSYALPVSFSGTIRQQAGRFRVTEASFGGIVVQTPAGITNWSAQFPGTAFKNGVAEVTVIAHTYDPYSSAQSRDIQLEQTVHLRGKK